MKIKSFLAKPYAAVVYKKIKKEMQSALADQDAILQQLLKGGSSTLFGKDHHFSGLGNYPDFREAVPIRGYEELRPYIDQAKTGKQNILWKGKPLYFAKTSGTTSGSKYIPISKDSISNHIDTARNALLTYMATWGNAGFADGKMIFLSGSPTLERVGGIPTGRLSGIVNHHIPGYLKKNQMPDYETNCIEDWEEKLGRIVEQTIGQNMTLISGIPPWMQMYFDWLMEKSGRQVGELFPNLQVLVHGGVNFEPYREKLQESIGRKIDTIETFPASEGFFAFQDTADQPGLLLNTNSGIFYEFVPVEEISKEHPQRLSLREVKLGAHYALIINSNAGLWGYNIGDTVRFVSLDPYRIVVTGRTKHFISAFGEHVIAEEVEKALTETVHSQGGRIKEFTVAPKIQVSEGLPYHEWWIEFETLPEDLDRFGLELDQALRKQNSYYDDLIKGSILRPLVIRPLRANAFQTYMKSVGKLGGQNKTPRLSNDRKLAEALEAWSAGGAQ